MNSKHFSIEPSSSLIRVLALTRKPKSPSFEQRVLNFREFLKQHGIEVTSETIPKKYSDRWRLIRKLGQYDIVWLHKHLVSFPEIKAWRRAAKRIIFDFDDPIFTGSDGPSATRRFKFSSVLRSCDLSLTSSEYLAREARPFCRDVRIVPMAIDLPVSPPPEKETNNGTLLLWLGSRATIPYLQKIQPALDTDVLATLNISLRIVSHEPLKFNQLKMDFRKWSFEEERRALNQCHIGLCPMPDTTWTEGKSPYKILQYMAYGIPWVGSSVGENRIMAGGKGEPARGLLAERPDQWVAAIRHLAGDNLLRRKMGRAGRKFTELHHERTFLASRLADILQDLALKPRKTDRRI